MTKNNYFLLLLMFTTVYSCNKVDHHLNTNVVTVRVDETMEFGANVSIEVANVLESRCALDVLCVWAGQAKIIVSAAVDGQTDNLELIAPGYIKQNETNIDTAYFQDYLVILHSIEPYPQTTDVIPLEDYEIKLSVVSK